MPGESQQTPATAPDPSVLTTEQLLRVVASERDYINGQIKVLETRLDGMDEATKVLHETVTRVPTDIQVAIGHLQSVVDERFNSTDRQFQERDIRTQQASERDAQALAAALQAAKELVGSQGEATAAAAVKTETSFTKQIDQIGTIINTLEKSLDSRITELKERIDRGEGQNVGVAEQKAQVSAGAMLVIGVLGLLLTVVVIGVALYAATH